MNVGLNEESQSVWQAENLEDLRYQYDLSPDDLVIDIGAYRGEWAAKIYSMYKPRMIVIEPGPWIVGFPIGQVINKAAGTFEGKIKFGGAYYYGSTYEENAHTEYECFDINDLLVLYGDIALVKINIEGGEYRLLTHIIEAGLHKVIRNLQIQFHIIKNNPYECWYADIEQKLLPTHKPSWRYSFCWENWIMRSK